MHRLRAPKAIAFFIAVIALTLIDGALKRGIRLCPVGTVLWRHPLLEIVRVQNMGAAFGIFSKHPQILTLLSGVLIAGMGVACIRLLLRRAEGFSLGGLALLLSGAIGNWMDRLGDGMVEDYLRLPWLSFPVFNMADLCITTGCFVLIFASFCMQEGENNDAAS